ncbi:immunoglobulin-like domain-containing protein [Rubrivirga sp. IMCC45206]|uniref:immunoglobulin-like domain-containing protein n=1 Tax=Rubrivirga sp. IMCC45206 TaxID=3391614 RepID=UPI00399007AC
MPAEASHFRSGTISYRHVSGNTVEFKAVLSYAISGISPGSSIPFNMGDGTFKNAPYTETFRDPANDYYVIEAVFQHTYAGVGPYAVSYSDCCRIALGNGRGDWNVRAIVTVGNDSPIVSLQPVVNLEENTPAAQFTVPVSDPDGRGTIRFRPATAADLGNGATPLAGLSVDPATGVVTVNTVGLSRTRYGAGIVVEEVDASGAIIASTMVDFIIRVIAKTSNVAPQFDFTVTPLNGGTIQVRPGQPLAFSVRATDPDAGDAVAISASGVPGTASLSVVSTGGATAESRFAWTPTAAHLGTSVLQFTAQDRAGVQTSTSVTIRVSQAPEFVGATPADNARIDVEPGQRVSFPIEIRDADPTDQVRLLQATIPAGATLGTALPSAFGNPVATTFSWTPTLADSGPTVLEFVADDLAGERSTQRVVVVVNAIPTVVTNAGLTLTEQTTAAISSALLAARDDDHGPADLTFTVTAAPTEGTLQLDGSALGVASTFTQADIDAGRLAYAAGHAHGATPDAVEVTVTDGAGAQIGPFSFALAITPSNRPPVADGGPDQTIEATAPAGTPVTLTSGSTDPDGDDLKLHWIRVLADGTEEHLDHGAEVTIALPVGTHTIRHRAEELTSGGVPVGSGGGHHAPTGGLVDQVDVAVTITDTTAPVLVLAGDGAITLECPVAFDDPGATATDNGDAAPTISVDGLVDHAPGTYTVTYTATDASGNTSAPVERTVTLVDTTAPVVALLGDAELTLEAALDTYDELGATVEDACDEDATLTIAGAVDTATPGVYTVTYTATDASGNAASLTRTVRVVDTTAPVVTLVGAPAPTAVRFSGAFADPGVTVADAADPAAAVVVTGAVDTTVPGAYTVTYTATDAAGNAGSASRAVLVVDDVAAVASAYLFLGDRQVTIDGQVRTEGAVHSNDKLELKKGLRGGDGGPSLHVGDLTSSDDLKVHDQQRVEGAVTARRVDLKREAVVTGPVTERAVARVAMPSVSVRASGPDVRLADGGAQTLAPGSYGALRVGKRAVLTLSAGRYTFKEIKVEDGGRIAASVATGAVVLDVEDKAEFGRGAALLPTPFGAADARYLSLRVAGGKVEIGEDAEVAAQVVAPRAQVRLRRGAQFVGVVVGGKVDVDDGASALFVTALSAAPAQAIAATGARAETADAPSAPDATPEVALATSAASMTAEPAPAALTLGGTFPNPTRGRATVRFGVPTDGPVAIVVYDVRGREVIGSRGHLAAGWHEVALEGSDLPAGVYVVRVAAGAELGVGRFTVVR